MSWIVLLGIAAVLVAVAALTGRKPDDTRSVSGTRLMTAARIALVVVAVILVVAAFLAWQGAS